MTLADISRLDLNLALEDAELSAHPVNKVRANGNVALSGPLTAVSVNGVIDIEELDAEIITPENTTLAPIEVVSIDDNEARGDANGRFEAKTAADLDLKIRADGDVTISGRGLESEWFGEINAVDDREGALLLGRMSLRRGALDFAGRRFDLTRGAITFDRLSNNNPLLDIRAELETRDGVTAVIAIGGRADKPAITLSSTPERPSEDIMALVLFGKPAENLSALESLQTAEALAALGGVGLFGGDGITGSLRRATGLDMVNFNAENGGSLTVGKYVADGLFISATQDAQGDERAVRVEYEITNNVTVETELKQDGDQTVSANWKHDF